MDYTISASNQTVYAKDTTVTPYGNIYSTGSSNTIYLTPQVAAATSYGTNYIYGVGQYNLLQYFKSPGPISIDETKGVALNGWGGTDYFSGINVFQLSNYSDKVLGNSESKIYYLGAGSDTIYGGGGFDVVTFYNAPSIDYQVNYDWSSDLWTIVNGSDVKKLYQIDEIQFGDKILISPKLVTLSNGSALSYAGTWVATPATSAARNGILAGGSSHALIKLDNSQYYGVVLTGWGYSPLDTISKTPPQVNISLLVPDKYGALNIDSSKYISDTLTWGAQSVIVADFNGDGMSDIFLSPYNETPFVPEPTTVYISNSIGKFSKFTLTDAVLAHDSALFYINGKPQVVDSVYFGGNQDPIYKFTDGNFIYSDLNITFQVNGDNLTTYTGASTTIGKFGAAGALELVRSDITSYSNNATIINDASIFVFSFKEPNNISLPPLQIIKPYLSTLDKYKNVISMNGQGQSHVYRVWSVDLNHDGALDVIAGESMWSAGTDSWPSALQILINKGDGKFVESTAKLNPDISLEVAEFDYTPTFIDLDKSGIETLMFAGGYTATPSRQSNFLLLNDGTGRLYVGLHEEFVSVTPLVYEFLDKQFAKDMAYHVPVYDTSTAIPKFIAVPQPNGSVNYVAEVQLNQELSNGLMQAQYVYVNVPLKYNPATDFMRNIIVSDRNNSMLMRTWAGNDIFYDFNSNSAGAHIDGGAGLDTSVYSKSVNTYKVNRTGDGSWSVAGNGISDTLVNVERLIFADSKTAGDLGLNQSAGETALLIGAVLPGKLALDPGKQPLLGAVIGLFDSGYSISVLAGALLRLDIWSILTGQPIPAAGRTLVQDSAIVNYLLTNINGIAPDASTLKANADVMHLSLIHI